MINFKAYLTEARMAPLYHATTSGSAISILDENTLYGVVQYNGQTEGKKVVFATRSNQYARYFARDRRGVIFVLDQQKLSNRYKIKPIKNWQAERTTNHLPMYQRRSLGGNEFEEIIITDKIANISNYISKIMIHSMVPMFDHSKIVELADEYYIPIEEFSR